MLRFKAGITYVHSHWQGWWSKALRPSAWLRPRPQDPPVRSQSTECRWAETCRRPGCEPPHGSGSGSCSGFAHWWQCCHPSFQKAVGGAQKEGSWSGNMSVKNVPHALTNSLHHRIDSTHFFNVCFIFIKCLLASEREVSGNVRELLYSWCKDLSLLITILTGVPKVLLLEKNHGFLFISSKK